MSFNRLSANDLLPTAEIGGRFRCVHLESYKRTRTLLAEPKLAGL